MSVRRTAHENGANQIDAVIRFKFSRALSAGDDNPCAYARA